MRPQNRNCVKREVTQEEFEKYLSEHPFQPLNFDGMRYTHPIKMRGLVWNKPVAYKEGGKNFIIEDK